MDVDSRSRDSGGSWKSTRYCRGKNGPMPFDYRQCFLLLVSVIARTWSSAAGQKLSRLRDEDRRQLGERRTTSFIEAHAWILAADAISVDAVRPGHERATRTVTNGDAPRFRYRLLTLAEISTFGSEYLLAAAVFSSA